MSVPVVAFVDNGVGKTTLVHHLACMLASLGHRVLACDFDPQANLTAALLDEDALTDVFGAPPEHASTVYRCVEPLTAVGDLREPQLQRMMANLTLLPGDPALAGFEDLLASEWPNALGSDNLYRPLRVLSAFWQLAQMGARQADAELILIDVGLNLGAISRSALIAADFVVMPLGADLFSLQALRNFGPTLRRWRADWRRRVDKWAAPAFELPTGSMQPVGYVVQQYSVSVSRPTPAYERWVNRMPAEYRRSVLAQPNPPSTLLAADDEHCLATLKPYRSLALLAQEARKPVFELTVADGALGAHALAVRGAYEQFHGLAGKLLERIGLADA